MASNSVGSTSDVSSSDSSDEDESQRVLEAAVLDCHHSTSMNGGDATKSLARKVGLPRPRHDEIRSRKPSLRPSKQETHEAENELNTTPEFRAFVGKKLAQILDSMIDTNGISGTQDAVIATERTMEDQGVRLFSSSSHPVCLSESSPVRKPAKKRPVESSSSDSSEEERLASAAVSHDFIFKDVKLTETTQLPENDNLNSTDNVQRTVKKKKKKKRKKNNLDKCQDSESESLKKDSVGYFEKNDIPCKKKEKTSEDG